SIAERSNVFSPTLNSIAKITGPITRTTSIRRPIRGMLNSKKIDPVRPRNSVWRMSISVSHAPVCVGSTANPECRVRSPTIARGSVAKNSSIEAPYQNRSDAAFGLTLDAAVSMPRSESKSDLLDQTDRCQPSAKLYPDCKQATLQTSSKNDSRVWAGAGYSRSVATGGSARVAAGKRCGGAGADRIGQDLRLRAALSELENSGGFHGPDPRTR